MRAEARYKTTVRSIGPLFHFINYFDSQSGGRGSGQRPIVASSQSCLNPFHARSVNLDCKDIKGGSPCQKFFFFFLLPGKIFALGVKLNDFHLHGDNDVAHVSTSSSKCLSHRLICSEPEAMSSDAVRSWEESLRR